jgi:hypothetical protein
VGRSGRARAGCGREAHVASCFALAVGAPNAACALTTGCGGRACRFRGRSWWSRSRRCGGRGRRRWSRVRDLYSSDDRDKTAVREVVFGAQVSHRHARRLRDSVQALVIVARTASRRIEAARTHHELKAVVATCPWHIVTEDILVFLGGGGGKIRPRQSKAQQSTIASK